MRYDDETVEGEPDNDSVLVLAAALLVGIFAICMVAPMVFDNDQASSEPPAPVAEDGPPIEAPTLDYEAMAGFDPQTERMNADRDRIATLEERVERLERIIYGDIGEASELGEEPIYEAPGHGDADESETRKTSDAVNVLIPPTKPGETLVGYSRPGGTWVTVPRPESRKVTLSR